MKRISPTQAAEYRARWNSMARHEAAELRATPIARKAQQLESLFASRNLFPPRAGRDLEAAQLTKRWRAIRAALDAL